MSKIFRYLNVTGKLLRKPVSRPASFMNAGNTAYMEQMYLSWLENPSSVHVSWQAFFSNLSNQMPAEASFMSPETASKQNLAPTGNISFSVGKSENSEINRLKKMIKFFRNFGHLVSDLDPLEMRNFELESKISASKFELEHFFSAAQADKPILVSNTENALLNSRESWTPRELHAHLQATYCGRIAFYFTHITDFEVKKWIVEQIELESGESVPRQVHEELLDTIAESQAFSDFCGRKFSTLKRFGGEGLDSGIVALKEIVKKFHEAKGKEFVLGMAHRGRLNTLTLVLNKPYKKMFIEFLDKPLDFLDETVYNFYGDVKYHNPYKTLDTDKAGNSMQLQMLPNPSHLEAVNPVVMGYSRGKMDQMKDPKGEKVLSVLVHGDAAISGQGIIYETLQMEKLPGYSVGGVVHLVFNNQIGFTTNPVDGRSTLYSSHIGKSNQNFIILVNADDPVKVRQAVRLGIDYRAKFQKDVFIEIIGYRKFGHNEQDNPRFTQPVMYQKIDAMKNMFQKYSESLVEQGIFSQEEIDAKYNHFYKEVIEKEYESVRQDQIDASLYNLSKNNFPESSRDGRSGVDLAKFQELGRKIYTLDMKDFSIDNTIKRIYKGALKSIESGEGINWSTAEHMAYATLLDEGHKVRLSGEDCERGTFSHRQALIVDQVTNAKYFPLSKVLPDERKDNLTIVNSLLSEYGVLGFDYGYSWARPDALTLWEAQFGDFANGAQIIIDQFLMNSEKKWRRFSGLVMLLPHGYDGNGPEHSNSRLERFLSNIDDDFMLAATSQEYRDSVLEKTNIQVANITSAANFFHALRNQVKLPYRKPLIVMSPKKILMLKDVQSRLEEFGPERGFLPVLVDECEPSKVQKVLVCSGQIYFDLKNRRKQLGLESQVALVRLERVGPFPYNEFAATMESFPRGAEVVFVSEENFNFGAFSYLQPRVNLILQEKGFEGELQYVGRRFSSSTSTGINWLHKQEFEEVLTEALGKLTTK